MKYLHFITKDQFYSKEFIDLIHSNFKIDEHKFIIIKEKSKNSYINPKEYQNIELFTISFEENVVKFIVSHIKFFTVNFLRIRKLMKQAEYIIVHFLTEEISLILFRFRGEAKIIWVLWGEDLYKYLPLKLYDDYTLELLKKIRNKIKTFIRKIYYSFNFLIKKRVIKSIICFISPFKGDFRLLKKYFKTKANWYPKLIYPNPVDFKKLNIETDSFNNENFSLNKKKGEKLILLGNSGSPTNNHLDIMIILSKMKVQNFRIICPLSYGNTKYINKIIENGKKLFGDRYISLLEFLEPKVYYQILKQIDLAVMYHNRQQGVGTINLLLYLGKPVCMKKMSIYFHLLEMGVSVFSIQDLERIILNEIEFTKDMSDYNKKITSHLSSVEAVISSMKNLFKFLENKNTG